MSSSIFSLSQPRNDFLYPALKHRHLRVTQASFHVVTHHAHAIFIAWFLKTRALGNICIRQEDLRKVTNSVYPDHGRWLPSPWERWSLWNWTVNVLLNEQFCFSPHKHSPWAALYLYYGAVPRLRQLVADLSPRRTGFSTKPSRICCGQSDTGIGFSPSTSVVTCQYHSTGAPYPYFIAVSAALYSLLLTASLNETLWALPNLSLSFCHNCGLSFYDELRVLEMQSCAQCV